MTDLPPLVGPSCVPHRRSTLPVMERQLVETITRVKREADDAERKKREKAARPARRRKR